MLGFRNVHRVVHDRDPTVKPRVVQRCSFAVEGAYGIRDGFAAGALVT
jgi:hypothetical protein